MDDAVSKGAQDANTTDLSFMDRFGSLDPFLKNDMRLIWQNKRPKTVLFMSFFSVICHYLLLK